MSIEKFEKGPSLTEQFEAPEVMEFYGGEVEVVDIHPENKKTEIPVVVAPGWAATPEVFRDNILTLAELGRRTISIKSPHGIKAEKIENFPEAELQKVAALIKTLKKKDIDKVDAVGHSEAGIYLTLAATLYPDKFRNIVLVDPGGMIGNDNPWRLSVGFLQDIVKQIMRGIKDRKLVRPTLTSFREGGKSISSGPVRAFKELLVISKIQIHELLRELKKKGVGISIIHAADDKIFPMDKIQDIAKSDQLDGFYSVKGTHNEFFLKPKKYTRLADQALTALESKHI
ncbi:alpha/beta hydrolase [Patescibacteria group bacterium AH-259-L05]|nr:alpha/beta hydrolase [Patescibacteria group bacterium AH-259-L05]